MKFKIEGTDLREITRNASIAHTKIYLTRRDEEGYKKQVLWLEFGELSRIWQREGKTLIGAYLVEGATDFEHDSAYALRLPLIGMQFQDIHYHATTFVAWVDPDGADEFRVPRPGYNPLRHPKAIRCGDGHCVDDPHVIVPEGFYAGAPFDPELFRAVAGLQVEIQVGVVQPKEGA